MKISKNYSFELKKKLNGKQILEYGGIALPLAAGISYAYTGEYNTAMWAGLCAFSSYNYMKKSQLYRKNRDLQLKLDKFLKKAEVEDIKDYLLSLDSWNEVSDSK